MQTKNQYLQTLISRNSYHKLTKKEKTKLLDEYCLNAKQNRKYVIRKIKNGKYLPKAKRITIRRRKSFYDGQVTANLVKIWELFDYPCGARLEPLLKSEVDRLIDFKELFCSDEVAKKLKKISPRTIDEKLKREKEARFLNRKYDHKQNPLLYQKIPVQVFNEQNRINLGQVQIDLVEHCGSSASGEYGYTLSTTDLSSNWWEGEATLTKSQRVIKGAVERARSRYPFKWDSMHSDNGAEFINAQLYQYSQNTNLQFSRSRPYRKNDNFLVEQKNSTHVRRHDGYLRYDTEEEINILNDLYRNELRLYKNFFQPVIRLKEKERIKGKIKRKYDQAKTPYQIILESNDVSLETKQKLVQTYQSLNPAELQRSIKNKIESLVQVYKLKQGAKNINLDKVLVPTTVTFLNRATS